MSRVEGKAGIPIGTAPITLDMGPPETLAGAGARVPRDRGRHSQIAGVGQEAIELAPPGWRWPGREAGGVRPASAGVVPGHSRRAPRHCNQAFELFWTHTHFIAQPFQFLLAVPRSMWDLGSPDERIKPRPVNRSMGVAAGLPGKASAVSGKAGVMQAPRPLASGSLHSSGPGRKGGTRMSQAQSIPQEEAGGKGRWEPGPSGPSEGCLVPQEQEAPHPGAIPLKLGGPGPTSPAEDTAG